VTLAEYKRKQIKHEDSYRPRYNLEPRSWSPVEQFYAEREYAHSLSLLKKLLPIEQIRTMLVCGVGAGADLHYWLTHIPLAQVFGLDFSIESIKASQRLIYLNDLPDILSCVRADFESIPLANNAVDLGVFVHSLHHALKPELGFKELWRVSKRAVLLIEPLATPVTRLFARIGVAQDVEEAGNKVLRFTLDQYLDWAGAECVAYRGESHFYYYHPLIYRRILPIFHSELGAHMFKLLYHTVNTLLISLHSKLVAVLVKQP
jgi:SAM-dependent methyltransferase